MMFFPQGADRGSLSYAYSFPSLGEAHNASGSYTIGVDNVATNTLLLTMKVSDHVTFKGYDGIVPVNYKFDLVHSADVKC